MWNDISKIRQNYHCGEERLMDCKSLIRPLNSSRIDNYQQSILSCLLLTCPAGNHNTCFFQRTTTVYIHYLIPSLQFSKATIGNCTIFLYLLLLEIIVHCADFSTFKRGEKKDSSETQDQLLLNGHDGSFVNLKITICELKSYFRHCPQIYVVQDYIN